VATSARLLDIHLYPGSNSITFNNESLTATAGVNYKIQVIATDKAVNQALASVEVLCN
jgi:hypothetical protein